MKLYFVEKLIVEVIIVFEFNNFIFMFLLMEELFRGFFYVIMLLSYIVYNFLLQNYKLGEFLRFFGV